MDTHPPTQARRQRAFTLVELVVVIVVLGILAVIAIPSYEAVKASSACASAETSARSVARELVTLAALDGVPVADLDPDEVSVVVTEAAEAGATVEASGLPVVYVTVGAATVGAYLGDPVEVGSCETGEAASPVVSAWSARGAQMWGASRDPAWEAALSAAVITMPDGSTVAPGIVTDPWETWLDPVPLAIGEAVSVSWVHPGPELLTTEASYSVELSFDLAGQPGWYRYAEVWIVGAGPGADPYLAKSAATEQGGWFWYSEQLGPNRPYPAPGDRITIRLTPGIDGADQVLWFEVAVDPADAAAGPAWIEIYEVDRAPLEGGV